MDVKEHLYRDAIQKLKESTAIVRKSGNRTHTGLYAAILIIICSLYAAALVENNLLKSQTKQLILALQIERTVIGSLGTVNATNSQKREYQRMIAQCYAGLIQTLDNYVFCAAMSI